MFAKKLNLKEVKFAGRSEMFLILDHVYVRGLEVSGARQIQLGISDHEPLQFKVTFTTSLEN